MVGGEEGREAVEGKAVPRGDFAHREMRVREVVEERGGNHADNVRFCIGCVKGIVWDLGGFGRKWLSGRGLGAGVAGQHGESPVPRMPGRV